jgi:UDP-3-O-[3-hydroxymyristoyl] glucosamine N-acyltransferase
VKNVSGKLAMFAKGNLPRGETNENDTHAAVGGLVTGLALASSETFAAGPMIAPGAIATTSVASAEAIVEKTVVAVRRRAVVRRPVVVHRRAVVRRPVVVHRRAVVRRPVVVRRRVVR